MKHIIHNKLVRDKIPDIITAAGKTAVTRTADREEYLRLLDEKLVEECREYEESKEAEELADMLEVMYAIINARGSSVDELERIRRDKAEKRGAFDERIFLEEVVEP